jgi:hypothetical protein
MERSPWHAGEQQLQAHVGVAERAGGLWLVRFATGCRINTAPFMSNCRSCCTARSMLTASMASVLEGAPGFAHSPDPGHLHFASQPAADDPAQLRNGEPIGLSALNCIRRRNRLNGHVANLTEQVSR